MKQFLRFSLTLLLLSPINNFTIGQVGKDKCDWKPGIAVYSWPEIGFDL